jgi:hypothetical protein
MKDFDSRATGNSKLHEIMNGHNLSHITIGNGSAQLAADF